MFLLYLFASLFVLYVSRVLYRRWKYDLHKVPQPPGLPLIGNTVELMKAPYLNHAKAKWHKQLGEPPMFKVSVLTMDILMIQDGECIKNLVLNNNNPLPRDLRMHNDFVKLLGEDQHVRALTFLEGSCSYIKSIRRKYLTAMSTRNLKKYFPKMEKVLDQMIAILEAKRRENKIVDVQEMCVKLSMDTIATVGIDRQVGALDDSFPLFRQLMDTGHMALTMNYYPHLKIISTLFPFSSVGRKYRQMAHDLTALWKQLADDVISRDPPNDDAEHLWYLLRTMIDPETGEPLNYKQMVAEIAALIIGGTDGTGHQISWILGMLAAHPRVRAKLYEELTSNLELDSIKFEDLSELPYLTAVVKEGLRVVSSLPGLVNRYVPEDMTILGYRIPRGTSVLVSSNRALDTEAEWGDPKVYRPERWLEGDADPKRHFMAFSSGPRDCVGQRMAMTEMRLAVAKILMQYDLHTDKPYEEILLSARESIVTECGGGMWIQVTPRDR